LVNVNISRAGCDAVCDFNGEVKPIYEKFKGKETEQTLISKIIKQVTRVDGDLIKQAGRHSLQVAKHLIKTGKITTTKIEESRRMTICKSNDCGKYDQVKKQCKMCGCGLSGKIGNMAKYVAIDCKLKKWAV